MTPRSIGVALLVVALVESGCLPLDDLPSYSRGGQVQPDVVEATKGVAAGVTGRVPSSRNAGQVSDARYASAPATDASDRADSGVEADPPAVRGEFDAGANLPPGDIVPPDAGGTPACVGSALKLDGSNFALIPRVIEDDLTIEAWIETTASRSGSSGFYGLTVFDADVPGMGSNDDFSTSVLNDRFAFVVGNPDTTAQGLTPVTTGQWVHVAVTRRRENGQMRILINGALDGVVIGPNRAPLDAAMTISFGGTSLQRNFIGSIDEVKIWNVARSVEQIASNMRVRPAASEEGLVGYYSFEDQGAVQTADGSSMGLAATLTGGPVYVPSSALCSPEGLAAAALPAEVP